MQRRKFLLGAAASLAAVAAIPQAAAALGAGAGAAAPAAPPIAPNIAWDAVPHYREIPVRPTWDTRGLSEITVNTHDYGAWVDYTPMLLDVMRYEIGADRVESAFLIEDLEWGVAFFRGDRYVAFRRESLSDLVDARVRSRYVERVRYAFEVGAPLLDHGLPMIWLAEVYPAPCAPFVVRTVSGAALREPIVVTPRRYAQMLKWRTFESADFNASHHSTLVGYWRGREVHLQASPAFWSGFRPHAAA